MVNVISFDEDNKKLDILLNRSKVNIDEIGKKVKIIIDEVKKKGDKALIDYTKKFDGIVLKNIKVSNKELNDAVKGISNAELNALKKAKKNIEKVCKKQLPKEWVVETEKGVKVGQIIRPINPIGIYVPGGRFPLVSSVLMNAVPAKVAGCKEIIMCTPPNKESKVNNKILAAAHLCGISKIFKVGGAQAIASMTYGTKSVPKVNKIVGPGNIFVNIAKKLVCGDVGIDFIAGPSEIMILAKRGNASFIAADMLSQAEHDKLSSALFLTTNKKLALEVIKEITSQLNELKNKEIAKESLEKYSAIVLFNKIDNAIKFANDFAPEHLEIFDKKILNKIENAGSIFIGEFSVESAGDYCSGSNHVLPTNGAARFKSGLSVLDFIKTPSIQELSKDGLKALKETIEIISDIEGLEAHKKSALKRFE